MHWLWRLRPRLPDQLPDSCGSAGSGVNVIPLEANEAYRWLIEAAGPSGCDEFDIHVVASIMALAIAEANGDESVICDNIGLEGPVLAEVSRQVFPAAAGIFKWIASAATVSVDEEEPSLRDVLVMYYTGDW